MLKDYAFDVAPLLGIGTPDASPLPQAADGEIVLRVPDGLTLIGLRYSAVGKKLMWQDNAWYDKYDWANKALPAGNYRLRLPVPGSNNKTFDEQIALLLDGEEVAPLVLSALALLCLQKANHPDPINSVWVRCAETVDGYRVGLCWNDGGLYVYDGRWVDYNYGFILLASTRTS